MRIKTIHYSALVNLGNYNNEKIGFTADLEEGETPEQAVEGLRQKVREIGGRDADDMYQALYKSRNELADLERKIRKAADQWNSTAEFLRAQGLKPEAPNMPSFGNLLPEAKEEYVQVFVGEEVDQVAF